MSNKPKTSGITVKDKLGYAFGDVGGLLSFSLISSYLQMFYTDVLHIPLAQITILMLVARIWDAINDPIWGAFVDSRKPTKWGRFRPYIFWMSFPLAVATVLMFAKIPGLTTNQYLIFAYITYIFYGMMYTGVNIPYGSLASVITDDPMERSSLSVWRSVGSGIGNLPSQILFPLLVFSTVAGTGEKVLDPQKLLICVLCLAIISLMIFSLHFKMTTERVVLPPQQKQEGFHIFKTVKDLLKNKPFLILCAVSMLLIAFQMYTQTTYNYLFKNYYGKPGLYALVTVCTYLPMAASLPFMGKLVRKFGKKELCSAGLLFATIINVIMYLLKFTPLVSNPYVFLGLLLLSGAGQTFLVLQVWALVMDVIDYHELLSKRREEGTSYALYSFTRKLGQTLAGAGSSLILLAIGYNVNATDVGQSQEVIDRLYDASTLIPAIILAIMYVLLAFCYKLTKERLVEVHDELVAQREEIANQVEE